MQSYNPKLSKIGLILTALGSFLVMGAACAYIAYDNRMVSPRDTPAEFAQHTRELNIVMTESFIGGGILGAAFGVAAFWVLAKTKMSAPD